TQIVQQTASGTETTCFNDSAAQYTNGTTSSILSVYDGSTQSAFGVTATGGPQEIAIGAGQIVWTVSGVASGPRTVALPAGWSTTNPGVARNGNTSTAQFQGGQQTAPMVVVFTRQ
ncbi:MAG TPA: hypothetical protein VHY84_27775, partial [Bryobacteraceae bacterium]|nr:hypothetical protein [Bryobacteraceae bacterium]